MWCHHRQDDWADLLALAEFNYNNQEQSSTGYSPFFANYGRHPNAGLTPRFTAKDKDTGKFVTDMTQVMEETQAALKKAAEDMKRFHDVHKGKSLVLKPGDKVLVENLNLKTNRPMKKLADKHFGPVEVLKKVGESTYKVKLPKSWNIHDVFNEVLLTKYNDPEFTSQQRSPPPPDVINEEEEFEVEAILEVKYKKLSKDTNRKGFTSGVWYLVQWKGYSPTENTWTQKENIKNADELITEFHNTHPDKLDKKG